MRWRRSGLHVCGHMWTEGRGGKNRFPCGRHKWMTPNYPYIHRGKYLPLLPSVLPLTQTWAFSTCVAICVNASTCHQGQSRWGSKQRKRSKIGVFITFAEIWGVCSMHHWLRGMDAPERRRKSLARNNTSMPKLDHEAAAFTNLLNNYKF